MNNLLNYFTTIYKHLETLQFYIYLIYPLKI